MKRAIHRTGLGSWVVFPATGRSIGTPQISAQKATPIILFSWPLLLCITACGESGPSDSALSSETKLSDIRLSAVRAQVYGAEDGAGSLSGVFDIEISPEGRVYASQPMLAEIAVFEPDGTYVGSLGGRGQGPGEFQVLGAIRLRGDTLTALDFRAGINLLSPEGDLYHRICFDLPAPPELGFLTRPITLLADGSVGCFAPVASSLIATGQITRQSWVRASREGVVIDTLIIYPLEGRHFAVAVPGRGHLTITHPAPWNDLVVVPPNGSQFVAISRPIEHQGEIPRFHISRIDLEGDTVQRRAFHYEPVPLTSQWRDSVSTHLAEGRAPGMNIAVERYASIVRDEIPWPEHHPPISEAYTGSDGVIWLKREPTPGDSVRWDIVGPNLEPYAHTHLPSSFQVMRVSRESVWGVELDSLDIPFIVRYDLSDMENDH